jgi:hypothetical protein
LGAGASLAKPSNLPTFKHILNSWIGKLADVTEILPDKERQSLLRQRIADTPPEVIFQSIDECKRQDLQKALSFTFNSETMPNTNHYIAAEVIRRGGVVWTTNFDVLVERASKIPPEDRSLIAFDHNDAVAFTNPNIKLLKPHGTIAVPESLIFRSKDVLRPLPDPVRQRLGQDVAGHFFVIIGYSASDVDLQPLLRQAIETAGDALWFCQPSEEGRLRDRFRQASQKHNIQFNISANPSCEFWKWARSEGLLSEVPDCLLSTPNVSALEVLLDDAIVLAKWFQRLRSFDVASQILKPRVFRHPRTVFSYLRSLRYQYHPLGTLSALSWYLLETMNPRTRDSGLYSLSYLAFDAGRYSLGGRDLTPELVSPLIRVRSLLQHTPLGFCHSRSCVA